MSVSILPGTNPFEMDGPWLRGNLHTHSTASDGHMTVLELARWYERHGYDFLCITDHDIVAEIPNVPEPSRMILIPGAEIGVKWEGAFGAEICALGIQEVRRKYVHPQLVVDDVLAQGGIAFVSHPHMSGVYSGLIMQLTGLAGVEVYNAACFGSGRRAFSTIHWDDLLMAGHRAWGMASDDRHSSDDPDSPSAATHYDKGKAWVMVKSGARTPAGILSAIRDGWFYSTTGPRIDDIRITGGKIIVKSSPVRSIRLVTIPWCGTCVDAGAGKTLTDISVDVGMVGTPARGAGISKLFAEQGFLDHQIHVPSYFRVECWDGDNGYAWSNPLFLVSGTETAVF